MKNVRLLLSVSILLVTSIFLTSCCMFTSGDCNCKPPKPFLVESTKDWIVPFESTEQMFTTSGSSPQEQKILRQYEHGTECIGGDECCARFPFHTTSFVFDADSKTLLYTKAIMDEVEFSADKYGYFLDTYVASFDVDAGTFSTSDAINLSERDTIINGATCKKIIFQKIDPTKTKILFKRLEFVKGVGVTSFTDTSGQVWTEK